MWQHVAVTFSDDTAKLYVDASAVATKTSVTMDPHQVRATAALLGRGMAEGSGYRGRVDSLYVYSDARTAAEILTDVRAMLGGIYTPAPDAEPDHDPGDYNRDGSVDAADYTVWRDLAGEIVAIGSSADGNRDGTIDDADFLVWRNHFGITTPAGSGAAAVDVIDKSLSRTVATFRGVRRRAARGAASEYAASAARTNVFSAEETSTVAYRELERDQRIGEPARPPSRRAGNRRATSLQDVRRASAESDGSAGQLAAKIRASVSFHSEVSANSFQRTLDNVERCPHHVAVDRYDLACEHSACRISMAHLPPRSTAANLAIVAKPSSSYISGDTKLSALNDGIRSAPFRRMAARQLRQLAADRARNGSSTTGASRSAPIGSTTIGGPTAKAFIRRRRAGCCIGTRRTSSCPWRMPRASASSGTSST